MIPDRIKLYLSRYYKVKVLDKFQSNVKYVFTIWSKNEHKLTSLSAGCHGELVCIK